MWKESRRAILLAGVVFSSACSGSAVAPAAADLPVVLAVTPAANSTSVDPSSPITIAFNRPMMVGMEMLIILHDGTAVGPQVPESVFGRPTGPSSLSCREGRSDPRQRMSCTSRRISGTLWAE